MKKLLFATLIAAASAGCQKNTSLSSEAPSVAASPAVTASPATPTSKKYDGPFGLDGAMPIADLEHSGFKSVEGKPGIYVGSPPRPLQDADAYMVLAAPKMGVCRIVAHVTVPVVNGTGDQVKAAVDRMADTMQAKYGKYSEKVDYIKQDVYRRNPEFWMMGLKEDSVLYAYEWSAKKVEKPLLGNLENIEVSAGTGKIDSAYVAIIYTYTNFDECQAELRALKAGNL